MRVPVEDILVSIAVIAVVYGFLRLFIGPVPFVLIAAVVVITMIISSKEK